MKIKKIFSVLFSIFFCAILSCLACFLALRVSLSAPDSKTNMTEVHLEIPSGSSVSAIAKLLSEHKLIRSDRAFYIAARFPFLMFRKSGPAMKSGFYTMNSSMSAIQIMEMLESGVQDIIKVSIPEGLTIRKIARILEKNEVCSAEDFIASASNPALLEKYAVPAGSFEGFLFPDTYFFAHEMTSDRIVSIMVEAFFDKIAEIPYFQAKTPKDFFDTLVLASIVEREYRVAEEAPLIASVFMNRVNAGVGLYSCATIEYIITEIQGKPHPDVITYDDLKLDSPYNTYKWAALPPAPISNPGLVALEASANPPSTDYFYFTLADSEAGRHVFSKSFNAHVKAGIQFRTKKTGGN